MEDILNNEFVDVSAISTRLISNRLLQSRKVIVPGLPINDESLRVAVE